MKPIRFDSTEGVRARLARFDRSRGTETVRTSGRQDGAARLKTPIVPGGGPPRREKARRGRRTPATEEGSRIVVGPPADAWKRGDRFAAVVPDGVSTPSEASVQVRNQGWGSLVRMPSTRQHGRRYLGVTKCEAAGRPQGL